ncbi:MAG TPA: undecaprenyl-diphosphate phosphatase [Solirubrobacteraceae bacterium]
MLAIASNLVTTFQAIVLGALQGVTELFPISSLGHTVLFPHLFGWTNIVRWQSQPESPWLAFIVMLHVGSAIGLLIYFWRTWLALIKAFFVSIGRMIRLRRWSVETPDEHLIWLIVIASIPTGILGIALEHTARVATAKPLIAAIFLVVNGFILLGAERARRLAEVRALAVREGISRYGDRDTNSLSYGEAAGLGFVQSTALIAGISRDGIVMAGGLIRGLSNYDAGRFAFLLATPIILAAGIYKIGDLTGPLGAGVRGPALIAASVAAFFAVITVAFLSRYLKRGNLMPFAIYCLLFGTAMIIYNA